MEDEERMEAGWKVDEGEEIGISEEERVTEGAAKVVKECVEE